MNEVPQNQEILTTQEVADYLRVSQYTIWRWCKDGRLPAFQVGREWRIRREKLDAFIEELEAGEDDQ